MLQDVRAVLVKPEMRDRHADLVQRGGPLQQGHVARLGAGKRAAIKMRGQRRHAGGVGAVDRVATDEVLDGDAADVRVDGPAEQIVEHAEAQRAADRIDALDLEFVHGRGHDRQAAGQDGRALRLERMQRQARDVPRGEHALLEPRQA